MSSHPQRLPLRIGPVEVDPPVLMAPMAGFTTFAFRHVLRTLGGCGLPTTEMFSARGLRHIEARGGSLPDRLWGVADEPRPLVVQIWDNDPATMASVGRRLATELGVSVVDLNFGCPVPDVALKAESGSYLLRSPERVGQIVSQVAAACAPTPVTAKIRLGVSRSAVNAAEVAQAVEEGGGAAVTIHGRTAADMYRGRADWDAIARVKDYLRRIPLIGNGDLTTAEAAVSALARYPVDGVMIGRAALSRPWIFRQCRALLHGEPPPPEPTARELADLIREHFAAVIEQHGARRAVVLMRKFASCYAHGRAGARDFRAQVSSVDSPEAFLALVASFLEAAE